MWILRFLTPWPFKFLWEFGPRSWVIIGITLVAVGGLTYPREDGTFVIPDLPETLGIKQAARDFVGQKDVEVDLVFRISNLPSPVSFDPIGPSREIVILAGLEGDVAAAAVSFWPTQRDAVLSALRARPLDGATDVFRAIGFVNGDHPYTQSIKMALDVNGIGYQSNLFYFEPHVRDRELIWRDKKLGLAFFAQLFLVAGAIIAFIAGIILFLKKILQRGRHSNRQVQPVATSSAVSRGVVQPSILAPKSKASETPRAPTADQPKPQLALAVDVTAGEAPAPPVQVTQVDAIIRRAFRNTTRSKR